MKIRVTAIIPAVAVIAVLGFSLAAPRVLPQPGSRALNFGYGFPPPPQQHHSVQPVRIFDTRDGTGGVSTPIGPNSTVDIAVTGQKGLPTVGVTAVVMNVTATRTTAGSYLTLYPTGTTRPLASNLNWTAGVTVPNLVEISLGAGGKVTAYNAFGNVDVVADVSGYVQTPTGTPGTGGLYNPVVPARVLDTRVGTGAPMAQVGPGATLDVQITGKDGVPGPGVQAVAMNITVTNATAPSYITAYPTGSSKPLASNLNFVAGQTVPNRVVVKVGTGGKVSLFNAAGSVDLIADINGWFTDGTDVKAFGSVFFGASPNRILDTRSPGFAPLGPNSTMTLMVAGAGGVPTTGVTAAVLNVTVTGPTAGSYLTVWPDLTSRPLASDLNFTAGLTVPNLTIVKLGSNGKIDIYNAYGSTHVIVDVVGWYQGG